MHSSSQKNSVYDIAPFLESDMLGRKSQIQQDTANMTQRIPLSGLQPANSGSVRTNNVKRNTSPLLFLPLPGFCLHCVFSSLTKTLVSKRLKRPVATRLQTALFVQSYYTYCRQTKKDGDLLGSTSKQIN